MADQRYRETVARAQAAKSDAEERLAVARSRSALLCEQLEDARVAAEGYHTDYARMQRRTAELQTDLAELQESASDELCSSRLQGSTTEAAAAAAAAAAGAAISSNEALAQLSISLKRKGVADPSTQELRRPNSEVDMLRIRLSEAKANRTLTAERCAAVSSRCERWVERNAELKSALTESEAKLEDKLGNPPAEARARPIGEAADADGVSAVRLISRVRSSGSVPYSGQLRGPNPQALPVVPLPPLLPNRSTSSPSRCTALVTPSVAPRRLAAPPPNNGTPLGEAGCRRGGESSPERLELEASWEDLHCSIDQLKALRSQAHNMLEVLARSCGDSTEGASEQFVNLPEMFKGSLVHLFHRVEAASPQEHSEAAASLHDRLTAALTNVEAVTEPTPQQT